MEKYTVLIDFSGTVRCDIEAESHEDAYKKVKAIYEKKTLISKKAVYEEYYYVESKDGIQEEF